MRLSQGHNVRKWSTDDANSISENPESAVTSSPQGLYLHRTVPEAAALSWGNHISPGFLSKPKGRVRGACPAHSARGRGWGASQTGLNSRPQAEADRKAGAATPRGAEEAQFELLTQCSSDRQLLSASPKVSQTFAVVNILKVN